MRVVAFVVAAAVASSTAIGQAVPPRPPVDTTRPAAARADSAAVAPASTIQRDSASRRELTEADTIKAPLPAAYVPATMGARSTSRHWTRAELFSSGALTVAELLERIPGVTRMAAGFIQAPSALAWHGDAGAVRLYVDGIEREDLTPRNAGVPDFQLIPLWSFEEVAVEETPGELRVHARTWRVQRTTAETRADVLTGSENLNLFRGFFGKRSANGLALQVAAQQAGTVSRPGMDGDALGSLVRLGWAGGDWSADITSLRQGINRSAGARYFIPPATLQPKALPAFVGSSSLTYFRAGWRQPSLAGAWVQFVAASVAAALTPNNAASSSGTTQPAADSADTTASQGQYAFTGGLNRELLRGQFRLSGTMRGRSQGGEFTFAPSVRAEWADARAQISLRTERRYTGTSTWDVRGAASPLPWLRVSAAAGVTEPMAGGGTRVGQSADVAFRWRDRWIGGGMVKLASAAVPGLVEFDSAAIGATSPAGTAFKVAATGPVWRGWNASTELARWTASSSYRPQIEAHSRVWFASGFANRFPKSNFHLSVGLVHDYRSQLYVPKGDDPIGQFASAFSVFGSQLEIRIASAVISWDYRNMAGTNFETFPGYLMPRIASVYGIRWEFWN
ncbi:MAG: Plug domain-containing protein [Gemmatimonadota bacterium]|nr:Plug domain-containing protein [Gemmatimonadota bacterium]